MLREIITGAENEGLFVTQFTISGAIDAPEGEANLSSFVPGIFRDVLSPDWILRERERLIGDNADNPPDNVKAAE